jgi:hypothetical protein
MTRAIPPSLDAWRFLARARQYRDQAMLLADIVGPEPNWPKHLLVAHAIELAINAYFIFEKGLGGHRPGMRHDNPNSHDLTKQYEEAINRGLKKNPLMLRELPYLSELHKIHYARYPKIETKPVPAFISNYDDMVDALFADVAAAIGDPGAAIRPKQA